MSPRTRIVVVVSAIAAAAGLSGCGAKQDAPKATQVVAKVNHAELSVHQLNFALRGLPEISPEQVAQIKRETLGQLVEQELIMQEAIAQKTDREPIVQQQLDAARRGVLARAYLQKVAAGVSAPDPSAIEKFYADKPELFRMRRIWRFAEIGLASRPANWRELERALASVRTIQDAAEVLRSKGIELPIAHNMQRGSEDMPFEVLPKLASMKDGDVVIYTRPPGVVIAQLIASTDAAVGLERAKPAIERFLLNQARAEAVQAEVKRIHALAKIDYVGEFAESRPVGTPSDTPARIEAASIDSGTIAHQVSARK